MCKQLKELKEGKSIEQPVYSYITCSRSKTETVTVDPADVIIIEGILVFTCKEIRDQMDIKIFVDADDDDRLMRVMARDIIERGKTVESVIVTTTRNKRTLKDARNTDAEKLYADAARLAKDLKDGFNADEPDEDYVATSKKDKKQENQQEKSYSGPSVLSWHLDGRKASHLPIPAYRCYGGGMVTVLIVVDNSGKVTDAKIQEETSTDDSCLRNFAIRAARASRFSSSPTAPSKQQGEINKHLKTH